MNEWKEIALEYKQELIYILEDLSIACDELHKKMPKSHQKVARVLEDSQKFAQESIKFISIREPNEPCINKLSYSSRVNESSEVERNLQNIITERKQDENSFSWLYSC